jgi:hypothetical protein
MLLRAMATLLCLVDALCASRRTRALLAFAVLLVLASGGVHAPMVRTELPVAGDHVVADVARHEAGPIERGTCACSLRAVAHGAAAPRLLPRWRDLRAGGLPAPRAPDAA